MESRKPISAKRVATVKMSDIRTGHRFRQDLGNIDELVESIKENGLITPITVKESSDGTYYLIAGFRRYTACKKLGLKEIPVNIYPGDITQLDRNIIELLENVDRKDMTYAEQVALTRQIHIAMQKRYGEVDMSGGQKKGHSLRDTAKLLGKSVGTVSAEVELAEAIEIAPELKDVGSKTEAIKKLKAIKKRVIGRELLKESQREEVLEGVKDSKIIKELSKFYIVGNAIECIKDVEDSSIDLVEIDSPYAVDIHKLRSGKAEIGKHYIEWSADTFTKNLPVVIKEAYRVLKPTGWIIVWFSFEPWFETVFKMIVDAGFLATRTPGAWIKNIGQTAAPHAHFGNAMEVFFYGRKTDRAEMNKQGMTNIFQFSTTKGDKRVHIAEKPIILMSTIYEVFCQPGSTILIPFLGSGNGILAAYNVKCTAFGWDLSEEGKEFFVYNIAKSWSGKMFV